MNCMFIFNPRCACTVRVTVVGSVCLCVRSTSHLSSVFSSLKRCHVLSEQWRWQICGVFSETAPLQIYSTSRIVQLSIIGHFSLCGKTCMRYHHVCMWWTEAAIFSLLIHVCSLAEGMTPQGYMYMCICTEGLLFIIHVPKQYLCPQSEQCTQLNTADIYSSV